MVDKSFSVYGSNRNKSILGLSEGPSQVLDDFAITAETNYPINFTGSGKRFALGLHYNGSNSFLLVNITKICQFKAKDSEIKRYPLCFGNISKHFTVMITNILQTWHGMVKSECECFLCWVWYY